MSIELQDACERGQQQLQQTQYHQAECTLVAAEHTAWQLHDWDTLARLYMPLQEVRRQRRQRCGEGIVCLDLLAQGPHDHLDARHVAENYPHGQLLVAGWASIEPAVQLRQLRQELGLYVETFLAAAYPTEQGRTVVILPFAESRVPRAQSFTLEQLRRALPYGSLMLDECELPAGPRKGNAQTYARVMDLWEKLHRPFLAQADAQPDPIRRIEGYRKVIEVDYACELAHQKLADTARELARRG